MMIGPELLARVSALLGAEANYIEMRRGGYTPALRFVVDVGGRRVFVKAGVTSLTAEQLRREIANYQHIKGSFVPELVAFDVDSDVPLLIIEDLSSHHWPPPWTSGDVNRVLKAIAEMHQSDNVAEPIVPDGKGPYDPFGSVGDNWRKIAERPEEFLSLGIVSQQWLEASLPTLIEAEDQCDWAGSAFCHFDLRSDNLCLSSDVVRFVDWNFCCLANPKLDLGFMLPSLEFEGGPAPEVILPSAPEIAATTAGFMALRAGQPIIPDAPHVRKVQKEQLSTSLPWAIRQLGLRPADGIGMTI